MAQELGASRGLLDQEGCEELRGSAMAPPMSQEPRCEAKHRFRGSAMAQEPGASRVLLDQEPLLGSLEASLNLIGILFVIFHQCVSGVFGVVCRIADPARVRWVAAHEEPPIGATFGKGHRRFLHCSMADDALPRASRPAPHPSHPPSRVPCEPRDDARAHRYGTNANPAMTQWLSLR